jgi:hypothetical protein
VRDVDLMVLNKKGEEIAIEVETGIGFKFHKGRILNKFRDVCNRYERVIVILTNSRLKPRYENLLKDLNLKIISRKELLDLFEVKK